MREQFAHWQRPMVAEKVTVVTRKAGESQAVRWESTGDGSYSIEDCEKEKRGTTITITLAKDFYGDKAEENFAENYKLESLVKKYSDYVRYPIKMNFEIEETPKDEDGKPIEGAEKIKRTELRTLNSMQALVISRGSGSLAKAERIENYYGFAEPLTGAQLEAAGIAGAKKLGIEFLEDEVVWLGMNDSFTGFVVKTATASYEADSVILAAGAARKAPRLPGIKELEGRGVSYCATCDAFFYRGKTAAVLGNGEYALHGCHPGRSLYR